MERSRLIGLKFKVLDLFATALIVLVGGGMLSGCSTTTETKLVGLIQSSKTDANDNPVAIYLWDGKSEYPIEENQNMTSLLEKIDSKVEAQVDLVETYGGEKTILIKKYKILKEAGE